MAPSPITLPKGYTVDAAPSLPAGYTLDSPAKQPPGQDHMQDGFFESWKNGLEGVVSSVYNDLRPHTLAEKQAAIDHAMNVANGIVSGDPDAIRQGISALPLGSTYLKAKAGNYAGAGGDLAALATVGVAAKAAGPIVESPIGSVVSGIATGLKNSANWHTLAGAWAGSEGAEMIGLPPNLGRSAVMAAKVIPNVYRGIKGALADRSQIVGPPVLPNGFGIAEGGTANISSSLPNPEAEAALASLPDARNAYQPAISGALPQSVQPAVFDPNAPVAEANSREAPATGAPYQPFQQPAISGALPGTNEPLPATSTPIQPPTSGPTGPSAISQLAAELRAQMPNGADITPHGAVDPLDGPAQQAGYPNFSTFRDGITNSLKSTAKKAYSGGFAGVKDATEAAGYDAMARRALGGTEAPANTVAQPAINGNSPAQSLAPMMRELSPEMRQAAADSNYRAIKEGNQDAALAGPAYEAAARATKTQNLADMADGVGVTHSGLSKLSPADLNKMVQDMAKSIGEHDFSDISVQHFMDLMKEKGK